MWLASGDGDSSGGDSQPRPAARDDLEDEPTPLRPPGLAAAGRAAPYAPGAAPRAPWPVTLAATMMMEVDTATDVDSDASAGALADAL